MTRSTSVARRALACLCVLTLAVAAPRPAAPSPTYPMIPQTLRDLVTGSDLVVWARVEGNEVLPHDPASSATLQDLRATLVVDEVYKGEGAPGDRVAVTYGFWSLCDAPPSYRTGERVLAFLRAGTGAWSEHWFTTTGTGYGTRSGTPEALRVWCARIRELVAIEQLATLRERRAATCEWITRLIEEPATAHQAYLELTRDPDDDRFHASPRFRLEWLGPRQLDRVRAVIARGDTETHKVRWLQRHVDALPEDRRGG